MINWKSCNLFKKQNTPTKRFLFIDFQQYDISKHEMMDVMFAYVKTIVYSITLVNVYYISYKI